MESLKVKKYKNEEKGSQAEPMWLTNDKNQRWNSHAKSWWQRVIRNSLRGVESRVGTGFSQRSRSLDNL